MDETFGAEAGGCVAWIVFLRVERSAWWHQSPEELSSEAISHKQELAAHDGHFFPGLSLPQQTNIIIKTDTSGLFGALFFFQLLLGVTRANDPPVPCGHRLSSCCLTSSIIVRKGCLATLCTKRNAERGFVSEVKSLSREWLRHGSEQIRGTPPTYVALVRGIPFFGVEQEL